MTGAITKCSRAIEMAQAWDGDPTDKHQRLMFIARLFGADAYVKGETTYELAALWGLSDGTVSNDAGLALHLARAVTDPNEVKRELWAEVYASLAESKVLRERVGGAIAKAGELEPKDWSSIATAWTKFDDAAGKALDRIAVFAGLVKNPHVQTNIQVNNHGASPEPLPPWLTAAVAEHDVSAMATLWHATGKPGSMAEVREEYMELGQVGERYWGGKR